MGQTVAHASGGEHGHRGLPAEAAEDEGDAHSEGEGRRVDGDTRPHEMGAPPEGEVDEADEGQAQTHVPRQGGPRAMAEPASRPRRDETAEEGGDRGGDAEQDRQVRPEHDEVARLRQEAAIESHRRERGGEAEEHTAEETHSSGHAQRSPQGRIALGPREHEAVEAALEIAEPLQLLPNRLHRGEGRPLRIHGDHVTAGPRAPVSARRSDR